MRFLHAADIHLDTAFASRAPRVRTRLRDAARQAFARLVDTALAERVHAVVIAGDLFDSERLSLRTERFLLEQLARLGQASIPVVYATGNHDPGSGSRRSALLPWPENVVVAGQARPVSLDVCGEDGARVGRIVAVGHETAGETRDLSALFPTPASGVPEVAVLHTQVRSSRGEDEHEPYAPSELPRLVTSGHAYWALGHVHTRQRLHPRVWYAGNPQGRTPRETGERGALLVDLRSGEDPDVRFVPLGPVLWEDLHVDGLDEVASLDGLIEEVQRAWTRRIEESEPGSAREWIVRVRLQGATPLWRDLAEEESVEALTDELHARLGVLDVTVEADRVGRPVDVETHRSREDLLGELLRYVAAAREGRAPLPSFAGDDFVAARDEADLRAMLVDAERELAARLLQRDERNRP
ncbi:MAG: DNA repair exonuclease [Gemmatimonadetes bacterium]|nr:MAG: DNA repair exonuclease [Gemmatimonadota bacterium]